MESLFGFKHIVCSPSLIFLIVVMVLISSVLSLLGVGLSFQARNWGWIQKWLKAPDPSQYTSDQWQAPGPFALQKRISRKTESSEASEVFIKRKRVQCMWINTQAESGGEYLNCWAASSGQFEILLWEFLLGFLWPIIFIFLIYSPYLVYLRILTSVHTHS